MNLKILFVAALLAFCILFFGCTETKTIFIPTSGADANITILQDTDFVTNTYCDMNFVEGVLKETTCR